MLFFWLLSLEPPLHYPFISHFVYVCTLINMMVFDFKNKYLNIIMISSIPNVLITMVAFQIADAYFSIVVWGYSYLDHTIRNINIHGVPFVLAIYVIRTQKEFSFTWNEYKTILIIYILWCYFLDYRYTDVVYGFPYKWYLFGNIVWDTVFVHYFLKSRKKKLSLMEKNI